MSSRCISRFCSMTTSVVCGGSIKSKPPLYMYRSEEPCRMDPQFVQLESQLAALRNQRHPMSAAKFPADGPPLSVKLPPSPTVSPKHDVARKLDSRGLAGSSLSSSSSSSLGQSSDTAVMQAEATTCSLHASSSSFGDESATIRDSSSDNKQLVYVTDSASDVSSGQRQSNAVQQQSSASPASVAATTTRRSVQSINEERSRFRIVKIDSYVDRSRWHCHNFADPPMHDDDIGLSAQCDSGIGSVGDDNDAGPSQIYYIAAGQNDGDLSNLSKNFYVSTIVYGVHGHPVLDRTVRMSPLQFLRRASDDTLPDTDAGEALTPTARDSYSKQPPSETPIIDLDEIDKKLSTTDAHCDNKGDHVGLMSARKTSDVMENDPDNRFSCITMSAHSSMPAIPTCSSQSVTSINGYDDVTRRPVTSLPLCHQDDAEVRCHNVSVEQSACLTHHILSADETHSATRFE